MRKLILVKLINNSVENHLHFTSFESNRKKVIKDMMVLSVIPFLVLLSPTIGVLFKEYYFIKSESDIENLSCQNRKNIIAFCGFFNKVKKILKVHSLFGVFPHTVRCRFLISSIVFYLQFKRHLKSSLSYTIQAFFLDSFFTVCRPEIIISAMNYDRFGTLLSELTHYYNAKYYVVQHGIIGGEVAATIPHKLYISKYSHFENLEMDFMSKVFDVETVFERIDFKSLIKFHKYYSNKKSNELLVAIASSPSFTATTIWFATQICANKSSNIRLIIYPHSKENRYRLRQINSLYPKIEVFYEKRHRDIDVLITYGSTIVYDYLSLNSFHPQILTLEDESLVKVTRHIEEEMIFNNRYTLLEKVFQLSLKSGSEQ